MPRNPPPLPPNSLTIVGHIVTARDVMLISADAVEEGRSIGFTLPLPGGVNPDEFQRRAEEAAVMIRQSISEAAGQAMAVNARVTHADQAALARNIAAKTEALLLAIGADHAAAASRQAPDGLPPLLEVPPQLLLMLEYIAAAVPAHQAESRAIARMLRGSACWEQEARFRTERVMPPSEWSSSMTEAESEDFAAHLAPPTPEQEARGRSEAAVFTAMKLLPAALGMLASLAGAAKQAADDAAARDSRDANKRGGKRADPFAPTAMRGIARAYRLMFEVWPEGKPHNLPPGRPDGRAWARAILKAAHDNLSRTPSGDSAFVAERAGRLLELADSSLGDHLNAAVAAESPGRWRHHP